MSAAQKALDDYETKPLGELIENAKKLIYAMCKDGPMAHWRMSIPVHPKDSDIILTAALTKAEQRVAELERHNELLRELYERHKHLDSILSDESLPPIGKTGSAVLYELWDFVKQAAVDGGAMESETERSLRTAWEEVQSGNVRPVSELWDGIGDGAMGE